VRPVGLLERRVREDPGTPGIGNDKTEMLHAPRALQGSGRARPRHTWPLARPVLLDGECP
jgi:hypothetical protein